MGTFKALKQAFQSIMKRTRNCQVDVETLQSELTTLFGHRVDSAFCAYRPKFERVPPEAHTSSSFRCVATLSQAEALSISDWHLLQALTVSRARDSPKGQVSG